jgi:hypothetical protein
VEKKDKRKNDDPGRAKHKSGGEPQKDSGAPRGSARRTGSTKQRKG